jgi:hypothetical protein
MWDKNEKMVNGINWRPSCGQVVNISAFQLSDVGFVHFWDYGNFSLYGLYGIIKGFNTGMKNDYNTSNLHDFELQ